MDNAIERIPARPRVTGILGRFRTWIATCRSRGRERMFLSELDDDRLRDLGLTRRSVSREAGRWPWDGEERR